MRIIIGGGTGFIGRSLVDALLNNGNDVTVVGRDTNKINKSFPERVNAIEWKHLSSLNPEDFDAIINLTGSNIAEKRWSDAVKAELLSSRIDSVTHFINWCKKSKGRKPHLYNASAIGYYGLLSAVPEKKLFDTETTETNARNDNSFCRQLVLKWEAAAQGATNEGIPLTIMRFGVVLKRGEGMLKKLELPTKFGMGAVLGSGLQPISWISADDLIHAILFLLARPDITGAINLVAPEVVSQQTFNSSLASTLHRPALLWMPAWFVKLMFGEMGQELLLSGQAVAPARLLDQKFEFKFATLADALKNEFPQG